MSSPMSSGRAMVYASALRLPTATSRSRAPWRVSRRCSRRPPAWWAICRCGTRAPSAARRRMPTRRLMFPLRCLRWRRGFASWAVGGRALSPAHRFFVDAYETVLGPTEVLTEVEIPKMPPRTGWAYVKFANKASRFAIVGVAALLTLDRKGGVTRARIAVTGAGPRPVRARVSERLLTGRSASSAAIEAAGEQSRRAGWSSSRTSMAPRSTASI